MDLALETASALAPAPKPERDDIFGSSSDERYPDATPSIPTTSMLWVDPMNSKNMDVRELNELLGRIRAMGMSSDQPSVYEYIGIKPDDREIHVPTITHLVAANKKLAKRLRSDTCDLRWVFRE